ncbi:MAG TPA: FG-GAP-like repeat-containing protein [Pyrinomonadaceae bacterium]|jgi:uncharacterized delta-60 repeat protein
MNSHKISIFGDKSAPFGRIFFFALVIFTVLATADAANAQLNLDPTFNGGVTDGDTRVHVTKPLADGKILVGGAFTIVNDAEKNNLARLNADGSLDNTFNASGEGPNGAVYEIIQLSDGKLLLGGSFTVYNSVVRSGIVRINPDGTLDSTFNPSGAGTAGTVHTIALQPDGKILISGGLSAYNGTARFGVIRLNTDGTLDTSFNSPFTSNQFVEEVDVQADGKILIAGAFLINNRSNVARLNADGSIDATFNPAGGGTDGGVYAMAVQSNGNILIGGAFQIYNNVFYPSGLVRLTPNGAPDPAFNPNIGRSFDGGEYFVFQPDGKILVAGGFGGSGINFGLIRLNANGSLDTTFPLRQTDNAGYYVALQADGKILLSGLFNTFDYQPRRNLVRLNQDGRTDQAFNPTFSTIGTVNALAQQTDGKILAGGNFNQANGASRSKIARFNADGSLDTTFNSGIGFTPDFVNTSNTIYDIAIQPDGKIIVGGAFGGYDGGNARSLARLNSDGTLDSTFAAAGVFFNFTSFSTVFDVLVQPDGKILVGGAFFTNSSTTFMMRLNSNGSLDQSFTGNFNNTVRIIVRQPDGKLLVGGSFTTNSGLTRNRITRLNADGSPDTTFNPAGGFDATVYDIALQPDGKILAVGNFTSFNGTPRNRIARLNANGSLDTSFDSSTGANGLVFSIALRSDGQIAIGGQFSTYNNAPRNRLAQLNSNGSLVTQADGGFPNNGLFSVRRLLMQAEGKLLVGGVFNNYGGAPRNSLLRVVMTRPTRFDFDADGKADVSVFRQGNWYIQRSTAGFYGIQFGVAEDRLAPADYDGDGKTDVAVFREGYWYYLRSSDNVFVGVQFGLANDVPVPADYDGDGRADIAVFRAGTWYFLNSSNNQFRGVQFGIASDKPVPANYDGDNRADIAVFRDGNWYWLESSTNQFRGLQFGLASDKPVPADYDGDGRDDQAVFRAGNWYIQRSSSGFYGVQFGVATDTPVPADYDGDGKADVSVFRDGNWYSLKSSNNQFSGVQFGITSDQPVPAAFVP